MRRGRVVALSVLLAAGAAAAQPAQGTGTTLTVGSVTVTSTRLTVRGALTVGQEAFAPVVVSTDGAGDAGVSGAGLDLGNTTFEVTGYTTTAPKVVVKMTLHDGSATFNGNAPATGFAWPITVTGDARALFLGAGAAGTNFTPRTSSWVGLCTVTAGWDCGTSLPGGVSASGVRWELPFGGTVKPGAAIDGGGTYGGAPSSLAWPSATILTGAPADTASGSVGYRIPGGVEAAITAEGDEEPFEFPSSASANNRTGAYTVTVDHPGTTGAHTLWLRSCHGAMDAPVCVVKTHPVTL